MIRIARVTNSAGLSGKTNLPMPTLIAISQELTAERNNLDELSASSLRPR
jgi:hypothetical protein